MAAGFDAAEGRVVVTMDADLQNDPADISRMLEKLNEGFEVVSGWRADRKDKLLSRRIPSLLANRIIAWFTDVPLHDFGCTLKAYDHRVIENLNLYGEMHRFLPALATWSGARVSELKVNHRNRRFGRSNYRINRTVRVLLDLITVKFLVSYSTRPMQVFGRWGLYAIFLGTASGMVSAIAQDLPAAPGRHQQPVDVHLHLPAVGRAAAGRHGACWARSRPAPTTRASRNPSTPYENSNEAEAAAKTQPPEPRRIASATPRPEHTRHANAPPPQRGKPLGRPSATQTPIGRVDPILPQGPGNTPTWGSPVYHQSRGPPLGPPAAPRRRP